jgi:hypothetical protein
MTKHLLIMLILTVLAVLLAREIHNILYVMGDAQSFLATAFNNLLPQNSLSSAISKIFILFIISVIIGVVIPFLYGAVMYKEVLKFPKIIWTAWLISLIIFLIYI